MYGMRRLGNLLLLRFTLCALTTAKGRSQGRGAWACAAPAALAVSVVIPFPFPISLYLPHNMIISARAEGERRPEPHMRAATLSSIIDTR